MKKPRGLRYVSENDLLWKRKKQGKKFVYVNRIGNRVKPKEEERIKKLRIPPAWKDVRISSHENGHVQAVGTDSKGRKQYIYHQSWIDYTQKNKFESLLQFGTVLPTLRETVAAHMRQHELTRERILATVVWLLEHTFIRVGNKTYAKENQSFGLTTMRTKHVDVEGDTIKFSFKGKSHVYHELDIRHPRVARTIKECIELPGYQIFKYLDKENNQRRTIDSADVNAYLKEITGDSWSAKDFRTWGGTTLAGTSLYKLGNPEENTTVDDVIAKAVEEVSHHLGNTVAVCREYYIHPKIIKYYKDQKLIPYFDEVFQEKNKPSGLTAEEYATLSVLGK
jgi:DNA topoisomerase-1